MIVGVNVVPNRTVVVDKDRRFNNLCGSHLQSQTRGQIQGEGAGGAHPPEMTYGFLIQLLFCEKKKKTMWFIGVEVEQETSAPPPKKIPGPAPEMGCIMSVYSIKLW